jgi:hypothetical protein
VACNWAKGLTNQNQELMELYSTTNFIADIKWRGLEYIGRDSMGSNRSA